MTAADETSEPPRRSLDPADIVWGLLVGGLGLVFYLVVILLVILYAVAGVTLGWAAGSSMAGWIGVVGGLIGLVGGIVLGVVAVVAVVVGISMGAVAMILVMGYVLSLDDCPAARAAERSEGGEPSFRFWPPPHYRSAAIIAVTAWLWAIYGLPALLAIRSWSEFKDVFPAAVILPMGFIGLVAHPWLTDLGERMRRHPRWRAFLGPPGRPPSFDSSPAEPPRGSDLR